MDLGFGNANQLVGQATASALLQSTKLQEAALDSELDQYDSLLQDDDALDLLREKRLRAMQQQQKQRNAWKDLGHGTYEELEGSDTAKAFFDATKKSDRLVVHFYRPSTMYCDIYHKHLNEIAKEHFETKFMKLNVESSNEGNEGLTYLVDKLGITVMPTVVLIQKRKVLHHLRGFDDMGGYEDFPTVLLKHVLSQFDMLTMNDIEMDQMEEAEEWMLEQQEGGGRGVNGIKIETVRRGFYDKGGDSDGDD
jgi:thiol-disulfide isomerase/thioredoxin